MEGENFANNENRTEKEQEVGLDISYKKLEEECRRDGYTELPAETELNLRIDYQDGERSLHPIKLQKDTMVSIQGYYPEEDQISFHLLNTELLRDKMGAKQGPPRPNINTKEIEKKANIEFLMDYAQEIGLNKEKIKNIKDYKGLELQTFDKTENKEKEHRPSHFDIILHNMESFETEKYSDFQKKVVFKIYALEDKDEKEKEILSEVALQLTDIMTETELPNKFETKHLGSVANKVVEEKVQNIMSTLDYTNPGDILPNSLTKNYPVNYESGNLEKAPWVNMIHAWNQVLNSLNTVSAIQKKEEVHLNKNDVNDLVSTTSDLVEKILLFGDSSLYRNPTDLKLYGEYSETRRREYGEKSVNTQRKIHPEEMGYMLGIIKNTYKK